VSAEPDSELPAAQAPPEPQQRWPVGAWMEWQVADSPTITGKSYVSLVINPDRDSVLQLSSCDSPLHEDYPSVYLQALTKAKTLKELVNQRLSAQLFIQVEADGNLLHNLPDQSIELVIREISGKHVRGTFSGQAHDVDSGGNGPISGKFQAVVESEDRS
jgi:hypothetical protein